MEITPHDLSAGEMYKLLIGCIVPRPIAWVASQDSHGVNNLAPFSFFNGICSKPLTLMIVNSYKPGAAESDHRKDTLRNIVAIGEYVINVVTEQTMVAMNQSAADYPPEIDEFAEVGMTPAASRTVRPPRVAESPINFECVLQQTIPIGEGPGSGTIILGTVRHMHVRDDLIDERYRIDMHGLQPIGRLAGHGYCYVHDIFDLERKPYEPR